MRHYADASSTKVPQSRVMRPCHGPQVYSSHFKNPDNSPYIQNSATSGRLNRNAPILLPFNEEIENLRPKSPPGGMGRGR